MVCLFCVRAAGALLCVPVPCAHSCLCSSALSCVRVSSDVRAERLASGATSFLALLNTTPYQAAKGHARLSVPAHIVIEHEHTPRTASNLGSRTTKCRPFPCDVPAGDNSPIPTHLPASHPPSPPTHMSAREVQRRDTSGDISGLLPNQTQANTVTDITVTGSGVVDPSYLGFTQQCMDSKTEHYTPWPLLLTLGVLFFLFLFIRAHCLCHSLHCAKIVDDS